MFFQGDLIVYLQMVTQMFPYPPYLQDNGINQFYGNILPTFIVFSLVLLSPTLIKGIVHEKETGVRVSSTGVFFFFLHIIVLYIG